MDIFININKLHIHTLDVLISSMNRKKILKKFIKRDKTSASHLHAIDDYAFMTDEADPFQHYADIFSVVRSCSRMLLSYLPIAA